MKKLTWHRDTLEGYNAVSSSQGDKYSYIVFQHPGEYDYELDVFPKGTKDFTKTENRVFGQYFVTVSDAKKFSQVWDTADDSHKDLSQKARWAMEKANIDPDRKA